MTLLAYALFFLALYILILFALSFRAYTKQSHEGYVIGSRNLGVFSTTCSMLAGQFNGGGVFILLTLGLLVGYGLLWFPLGTLLGYIFLSFFAKTIHTEGILYQDVNVPDILHRRIGSLTQHFGSFIIIGKAVLFGTAQLLIAGTVLGALVGIPSTYGIFITATIISIYVYLGGYITIIQTDVMQWLILFLIAFMAAIFLPFPSLSEVTREFIELDDSKKWGFLLFTFVLIVSNADAWQRVMSAGSAEVARKSLILSGVFFFIFIIATIIIVKTWGVELGHSFTFFSLFQEQALSPIILASLGIFTLTAVMSTIDTQVQIFTSAWSKNVRKIDISTEREQFVKTSRYAALGLLGTMALAASIADETMEFVLKAFSFAYILAPVLIAAMLWGKTERKYKDYTCIFALFVGLSVYTYMFFNGYFAEVLNTVIPTAVTATICLLGYLGEMFFLKVTRNNTSL